jgi:hypothetical protein
MNPTLVSEAFAAKRVTRQENPNEWSKPASPAAADKNRIY